MYIIGNMNMNFHANLIAYNEIAGLLSELFEHPSYFKISLKVTNENVTRKEIFAWVTTSWD